MIEVLKVDLNESPQSGLVSIYSENQFRFASDVTRWWIRDRTYVHVSLDDEARTITFTPTQTKRPFTRQVSNKMIGGKRVIESLRELGCKDRRFTAALMDRGIGSFQISF